MSWTSLAINSAETVGWRNPKWRVHLTVLFLKTFVMYGHHSWFHVWWSQDVPIRNYLDLDPFRMRGPLDFLNKENVTMGRPGTGHHRGHWNSERSKSQTHFNAHNIRSPNDDGFEWKIFFCVFNQNCVRCIQAITFCKHIRFFSGQTGGLNKP